MTSPWRFVLRATLSFLFLLLLSMAEGVRTANAEAGIPVLLLVHGDDLPRERLRDLVAKELGKPVTLDGTASPSGVVTVTYRKSARELAVTWDGPKRGTVSRVVTAPARTDDVLRDAALLAGNLAHDEADELLANASPPPPLPPSAVATTAASGPNGDAPSRDETATPREGASAPDEAKVDPMTAGFFYPLASNFGRPGARTHFDLNLIMNRVGELVGVQIGGVNVVARAGSARGNVSGMQLAWGANVVGGKIEGIQMAPLMNVGGADVEGWQTAALLNHVSGNLDGAQIATVNVARDVRGAQVGIVNVGQKVTGTMIGLVNVADEVEGVPVGLASVTKAGGVHPEAWASNATFANVGVKFATKHSYTMPSAHYHRAYDRDFVGAGFTLGGHVPFVDREDGTGPYVDIDLSFALLVAPKTNEYLPPAATSPDQTDTYHQILLQPRLRGLLGWRFVRHFGVFLGPGLLVQTRLLRDEDEAIIRVGPEMVLGVEL